MRSPLLLPCPSRTRPLVTAGRRALGFRGFTLIEMLVVIGVMAVLVSLAIPAYNSMGAGANLTKAVYDVQGILEEAHTYAMANNTYVWVGVLEEDDSQPSPVVQSSTPIGRVVVSVVASQDGTRYSDSSMNPDPFGKAGSTNNVVQLVQVEKLLKLDNIHLASFQSAVTPARPFVNNAYQMGDSTFAKHSDGNGSTEPNLTTFTYPLTVNGKTPSKPYSFSKIIEFNPHGEASKIIENTFAGPGPQALIEFGIQPTHQNLLEANYSGANASKAAAVLQLEGVSGKVRIFRQ